MRALITIILIGLIFMIVCIASCLHHESRYVCVKGYWTVSEKPKQFQLNGKYDYIYHCDSEVLRVEYNVGNMSNIKPCKCYIPFVHNKSYCDEK